MKRLFDIIASLCLIVIFSPVLFLISILVRLTSFGSILFIQDRIGLRGRVFKMYKFRTMYVDSEKLGTGLFSFKDDPRITPIGAFLRRFSFDELPQLFNVLSGSMSLVGPRPPVTYELGPWNEYTPHMRKRFNVRPGITGLAQVTGRNDLSWDNKIDLDNLYVDRLTKYGFLADIPILIKTFYVVLSARNVIEKYNNSSTSSSTVAERAYIASNLHDLPASSDSDN